MGLDPAYVMRQRPAEGRRLVEIAEEDAKKVRDAELKLAVSYADAFLKSQVGLAQMLAAIARRPTL